MLYFLSSRGYVFFFGTVLIGSCGLFLHLVFGFAKRNQGGPYNTNPTPLCIKGILDKSSFQYSFDANYLPMQPIPNHKCKLNYYGKAEVLKCFETLSKHGLQSDDIGFINIAFIGDSRMRQFYLQFLTLFPWQNVSRPFPIMYNHADMSEVIPLLHNVRVSFYWQPLMFENVTDNIISHWADTKNSSTLPHLILLGITAHHMMLDSQMLRLSFEQKLMDFLPTFDRLSRRMKKRSNGGIVWMNQYPVTDLHHFKGNILYNKINGENFGHFNSISRSILSKSSAIRIWDSLDLIMADYLQSCWRHSRKNQQYPVQSFYDCDDFVHVGFVALREATQLLVNDICNRILKVMTAELGTSRSSSLWSSSRNLAATQDF